MKHVLVTVTGIALMVWNIFSSANEYPLASLGKEDGFVELVQHRFCNFAPVLSGV